MISAQDKLSILLDKKRIPQALLLAGPQGSGKKQAAYHFSKSLLNTSKKLESHPDFHQYFPEGKLQQHSIENMRHLIHDVTFPPYEAKWKIYLIHEADRMLSTSGNALLKTLEEPTAHTLILLLSHHPDKLLSTILSRCQTIEFSAFSQQQANRKMLCFLEQGILLDKFKEFDQEDAESVFRTILLWHRDRLAIEIGGCEKYLHFPDKIEQIKKTPLIPLEKVEKALSQVQGAQERSTKLSLCLEILFRRLFSL